MTGYYSPYPVSVQLLQKHNFCTLDKFRIFVNSYEYTYSLLISTTGRATVKQYFQTLPAEAPFSEHIQFPKGFYIDMDCATIRTATKQFWNAMFRLDLWEKEANGINAIKFEYIDNVTDAKQPCDEAFTKLADIIMSTDSEHLTENGIYSRETFEKKYQLQWCPKGGN